MKVVIVINTCINYNNIDWINHTKNIHQRVLIKLVIVINIKRKRAQIKITQEQML